MKNYHSNCLVCESDKLQSLKGYEKHELVKCGDCKFVFMHAVPSLQELNSYYGTYSYGEEQFLSPITIKSYNSLLDEFEKYRKSNKILDVGCGAGFFLQQAKKRGWEVYGTEFSSKAIQICRSNGITMKEGVLNSANFDAHDFDVVTSFEVIEHINNPVDEISEIKKMLRTGGLFYCTTPNFDSLLRYYLKDDYNIICYPEHLSYYTKPTLDKLMTRMGFERKKFLCTGISISRFNTSTGRSQEKLIAEGSSDEKLRREIEGKWYLGLAKNAVNGLLTATSSGMTLKGYYEKRRI